MSFQNFIDKFMKLPVMSKLTVIYTELMIVKDRLTHEFDDRPAEVIQEFPLRKIPLNACICGHGSEDHETEFDPSFAKLGLTDGMCEKCVCRKFTSATLKDDKK